jgi:hypothetical protein
MRLIAIVCTEPEFEWKSRLLIRSLRKYGGNFGNCDVISYSPRPDYKPSAACLADFKRLGVETQLHPLNTEFPFYGLSNKIFAMAHAEKHFGDSILLFLDSDKIFVDVPAFFSRLSSFDFAARPVDRCNIGAENFEDPKNGSFWRGIYDICGSRDCFYVETTIEKKRILAYFNSGMIAAPSEISLFSTWLGNFKKVWDSPLRPSTGNFFVEQSVLAASVAAVCKEIFILPRNYNIPVHMMNVWTPQELPQNCAVSLHYHRMFDHLNIKERLQTLSSVLPPGRLDWITDNVNEIFETAR